MTITIQLGLKCEHGLKVRTERNSSVRVNFESKLRDFLYFSLVQIFVFSFKTALTD